MNSRENIPGNNLKIDLGKAEAEEERRKAKEIKTARLKELTERKADRLAGKEAEVMDHKEIEEKRLRDPQNLFPKKSEWNELNKSGQVNLKVHLYGRKMSEGDVVIIIGEKKGQMLKARFDGFIEGFSESETATIRVKLLDKQSL